MNKLPPWNFKAPSQVEQAPLNFRLALYVPSVASVGATCTADSSRYILHLDVSTFEVVESRSEIADEAVEAVHGDLLSLPLS